MQQSSQFDISKIKGFVKRRWKWFLVPFVTLLIGTIVATTHWPWKKYPAEILIDIGVTVPEKAIDSELHRYGASREMNAKDKLETLRKMMVSEHRIRELITGTENTGRIEGLGRGVDLTNPIAVQRRVRKIQKAITLEGGTEYVTVRFSAQTPELAKTVLVELFGRFHQNLVAENKEDYEQTVGIRRETEDKLKDGIRKAEIELRDFKERNTDKLLMKDPDFVIKRKQETESRLAEIVAELEAKRSRIDFLVERLEETRAKLEKQAAYPRKTARRIKFENAIAELEIQFIMLKDQYTDEHPRMVTLQEQINKLKDEMDKEPADEADPTEDPDRENPKYAEYRDEKNKTELEIRQLEAEYKEKKDLISGLEEDIRTIPRLEEQKYRLERVVETTKRELERAIQAHAEARERADLAKIEKINAFKLARVDASPMPDPKIWQRVLAGGLFITIVISVGLVAVRELTDQSLKTVDEARDFLELPSLGIVPVIVTPRDRRRKRIVRLIKAITLALVITGAVVFCWTYDPVREDLIKAYNDAASWIKDQMP